jgi:hypothetical protein
MPIWNEPSYPSCVNSDAKSVLSIDAVVLRCQISRIANGQCVLWWFHPYFPELRKHLRRVSFSRRKGKYGRAAAVALREAQTNPTAMTPYSNRQHRHR